MGLSGSGSVSDGCGCRRELHSRFPRGSVMVRLVYSACSTKTARLTPALKDHRTYSSECV